MKVEIWSDIVCPFCYIGKRHFEAALENSGQGSEIEVTYRSFELDPSAPKSQTRPIVEILAEKYGRPVEWARQANAQVTKMGEASGIRFAMERVVPTNSFDGHRLIRHATTQGREKEAVDALFAAYFEEGQDIALPETLRAVATKCGLDADAVIEQLRSGAYADEVRAEEIEARQLGIQGVPFFLFDRKLAVSGAQPVEAFLEAIHRLSPRA